MIQAWVSISLTAVPLPESCIARGLFLVYGPILNLSHGKPMKAMEKNLEVCTKCLCVYHFRYSTLRPRKLVCGLITCFCK